MFDEYSSYIGVYSTNIVKYVPNYTALHYKLTVIT